MCFNFFCFFFLWGVVDCVVQVLVQVGQGLLQCYCLVGVFVVQQLQFVGQVQCGQYGDVVDGGYVVVVVDFVYVCIEQVCSCYQVVVFVGVDVYGVFMIEDVDVDWFGVYVCCFRDLSWLIIVFICECVCLFLVSSVECLVISCFCWWCRLWFFLVRCWLCLSNVFMWVVKFCSWVRGLVGFMQV